MTPKTSTKRVSNKQEIKNQDSKNLDIEFANIISKKLKENQETTTNLHYVDCEHDKPISRHNMFMVACMTLYDCFSKNDIIRMQIHGILVSEFKEDDYIKVEFILNSPGYLIGKGGYKIDEYRNKLTKIFKKKVIVNIEECNAWSGTEILSQCMYHHHLM